MNLFGLEAELQGLSASGNPGFMQEGSHSAQGRGGEPDLGVASRGQERGGWVRAWGGGRRELS